jgi:hypothetical protein
MGHFHVLIPHVLTASCRCAAAVEVLDKAQSLANVQADDSYLCALMAAAEGNLSLQQQQTARCSDTAAGGDPHTPHAERTGHSRWV